MNNATSILWDFFIAYSSRDVAYADRLFETLSNCGRVFIDHLCLQPGDIWAQQLRSQQERARCTILLVTENTDHAWFAYSEYVHAIELTRTGNHRIIPILIGKESKLPYGLEQIHALRLEDGKDFTSVCRQIVGVLDPISVDSFQNRMDVDKSLQHKPRKTWKIIDRKLFSMGWRQGAKWSVLALFVLALTLAFFVSWPQTSLADMERVTTSGNALTASVSPDENYVAYAAVENGGQSLRIRNLHGEMDKEIIPVTHGEYTGITFSKDGLIYYVFSQNGLGKLYRIPMTGGPAKLLANDVDSAISISPDGKRLVFRRQKPNQSQSQLILYDIPDEMEQKVLKFLVAPDSFWSAPLWSRDGSSILCEIFNYSSPKFRFLSIRLEDGKEQVITPSDGSWYRMDRPTFLKQGRSIAVAAARAGSNRAQIIEISLPGGKTRPISNDLTQYADLDSTPDAKTIVAIDEDRLSGISLIPLANPDKVLPITQLASRMSNVTWTPEGKLISQAEAHGHLALWEVDPKSREETQLTNDVYMEYSPVVSPDGKYLLYLSDRDGPVHVWRARRDGKDPRRLTLQSSQEDWAAITPDSQWVIYTSSEAGYPALWKISINGGKATQLTVKSAQKAAISPNGRMLACEYFLDAGADWSTAILSIETGKLLRLISNARLGDESVPVRWSSDNRSLLYVKTENNISNVWSQPIDGGPPRPLTHFSEDRIFAFSPSTDGKYIASIRGTRSSDVVLLKPRQ
jgi:Tol biopolymer transport system component